MQTIREVPVTAESTKKYQFKDFRILGILFGLLALGMLSLVILLDGPISWGSALVIFLTSVLAFSFLSPWEKINYSIWGTFVIALGIWIIVGLPEEGEQNLGVYFFGIASCMAGFSMLLRTFNHTFWGLITKFFKTKIVRKFLKIVGILLLVAVGLALLTGAFSIIAGLSATTIIIILLVLIWLK